MLAKSETYKRGNRTRRRRPCVRRGPRGSACSGQGRRKARAARAAAKRRAEVVSHMRARGGQAANISESRRTGPRSRAGRTCTCGHARVRASGSLSQGTKTPWGKAASSVPGGQMCGAGRRAGRRAALSSGQALIASQRQAAQTTRWQHHKGPSRMWAAGVRSGVRLGSPLPEVDGHRKPAHRPSTARPHARRR